jgi:hypothetical protein
MTQSLFLESSLEFTKLSSETSLPDDPNQWSDEVLQELAKQVPYLADFDTHVVMENVDGERGYGLGHVEVSNKSEAPMTSDQEQLNSAGIRHARIPVIIRDNKLQAFDVVLTEDSKALPLTEGRLRQALFRPQNFDVTSKTPGDQSMIGQLYPPFRQNYGFGGGGVSAAGGSGSKTASAANGYFPKEASVLEGILSSVNVSDLDSFKSSLLDSDVKLAYASNPAAFASVVRCAEAAPITLEKRASALLSYIKPSVVQVEKVAAGYMLRTANHATWQPHHEYLDRGELVRRVGEKIALATDLNGAVTVGVDAGVSDMGEAATLGSGPADQPGIYSVETDDGQELSGSIIPNLLDVDGTALPIALFTDGQHVAVQSDISGTRTGEFAPPGMVSAAEASGHGVFYTDAGGVPVATLPLSLGMSVQDAGEGAVSRSQAETFDGRQVQVSVQPYVQSIQNVDGIMLVPDTWMWVPLSEAAEVSLAEHAGAVGKTASVHSMISTVVVRGGGVDSFSLSGLPLEKVAAEDRSFLSLNEALFLLVGMGANGQSAQQKLAAASLGNRPETVRVAHTLKTAHEVRGESELTASDYLNAQPVHRHRMWKEAAMIPDPTAVDAVLSLGFINPENIATFVGYLPTLDEAQSRMCELLVGARLGMRELSEGSLERAIRALEDVIQGLRLVAFQG